MALYQNGTLISGANTLPQMTLAEYQALPVSERPTYWERTDLNYGNIPASDVTYGSGSVEDALDDLTPRFRTITSGSFHDILNPGIYYVTNAVTDKPTSTGGAYFVSSQGGAVGGLYIQVGTGKAYVVRYTDSTWTYTPLN